jgi:hypothetical protein
MDCAHKVIDGRGRQVRSGPCSGSAREQVDEDVALW